MKPTFDVRLWCNECSVVIGTVNNVPDNDPKDYVVTAMQQHVVTTHPLGQTPKRGAPLSPREVECPTCRAKPGRPCMRPSGHPVFGGGFHAPREKAVAR